MQRPLFCWTLIMSISFCLLVCNAATSVFLELNYEYTGSLYAAILCNAATSVLLEFDYEYQPLFCQYFMQRPLFSWNRIMNISLYNASMYVTQRNMICWKGSMIISLYTAGK
jgi:hypothetical protein